MQGLALGIGGLAGPVEIIPETTHTTNGLATFSGWYSAEGGSGVLALRLRAQPLRWWMK